MGDSTFFNNLNKILWKIKTWTVNTSMNSIAILEASCSTYFSPHCGYSETGTEQSQDYQPRQTFGGGSSFQNRLLNGFDHRNPWKKLTFDDHYQVSGVESKNDKVRRCSFWKYLYLATLRSNATEFGVQSFAGNKAEDEEIRGFRVHCVGFRVRV